MMAFPLSVTGSFTIERNDVSGDVRKLALEQVEAFLRSEYGVADIDGETVRSHPNFGDWYLSGRGRLHPIALVDDMIFQISGSAETAKIRFTLSTKRIFFIVLVFALLAAASISTFDNSPKIPLSAISIAAFAIGWLFITNYILTMLRAPRWLRKEFNSRITNQESNSIRSL